MGLHVLDAEPDARGPHKLGDFRKRVAPRGFVADAVVDQLDESLGVDHRNTPQRVLLDSTMFSSTHA
jgi:hypothetical protein